MTPTNQERRRPRRRHGLLAVLTTGLVAAFLVRGGHTYLSGMSGFNRSVVL